MLLNKVEPKMGGMAVNYCGKAVNYSGIETLEKLGLKLQCEFTAVFLQHWLKDKYVVFPQVVYKRWKLWFLWKRTAEFWRIWAGFFVAPGVNVINLFTSFCPCKAFTALSNVWL